MTQSSPTPSPSSPNAPRRAFLVGLGVAALAAPALIPNAARAAEAPVWTNFWGLAIRGYDPVAYFDQGRPVEGSEAYEIEWNGAKWRFASAETRDRFVASPERYAPQYGGYCAWAVSRGYLASVDPQAWSLVDGKLYLNYSVDVRSQWERDVPGNIARGDANWPSVLN